MAGIYVHIPFCRSKCSYCNFFSVASTRHMEDVFKALLKEIAHTKDYLSGEKIASVYFGGGTPSLPDAGKIQAILEKLLQYHELESGCEITLEANPDDLSTKKVKDYLGMGINRLSLGIQSFHEQDLRYLHRKHDPASAVKALELLLGSGFTSFSVDLIFGIPGQTNEMLIDNLTRCINAGIPHLSCYNLTVEPQTALSFMISKGEKEQPDEDLALSHFFLVHDTLEKAGYLPYEISNFARDGHLAVHNTSYWFSKQYLGLGPSAHSYNKVSRRWNHSSVTKYLHGSATGDYAAGEERLSAMDHHNEFIMTRLRTIWGIDLDEFMLNFGETRLQRLVEVSETFLLRGWLSRQNNRLVLTREGKPLSDHVIAVMFLTD